MVPTRIMIKEPHSKETTLALRASRGLPSRSSPASAPGFSANAAAQSSNVNPALGHIRRIVTAHQDRLLVEILGHALAAEFPCAHLERATSVETLRSQLIAEPADLVVASASLSGGDEFSVLAALKQACPGQKLLFVTMRCDYQIVQALRSLGARGAIDTATDDIACFREAVRRVANGQTYWSASLQPMLRGSLPSTAVLRHLTPMEMYMFAILGDGCSDGMAAAMVDLSEQSVHSYRKRLHRKLGIQHKGALVTRAFQYGLVRATPEGVERPGLELLRVRCPSSRRRRSNHLESISMPISASLRSTVA